MDTKKVLLTGVSGFLGSHTAIQLLEKGYQVRGTLRTLNRVSSIKDVIAKHTRFVDHLSFVEADLSAGDIWADLMTDIDYVQHIASPFPRELPKHEDELVPIKNITEMSLLNKIKDNDFLNFGDAKSKYREFFRRYPDLALLVPQQYIASYLKITSQSLSRIRRNLK